MAGAVNVHEAKTTFSKLLKRVQLGEEIVIAKAGKPVARLTPLASGPARRKPGGAQGRVTIGANFDAPLPEELRKALR